MARKDDTQSTILALLALGITGGLLWWGSARNAQAGQDDDFDPGEGPSPDDAPGLGEDDEVDDGTPDGSPSPGLSVLTFGSGQDPWARYFAAMPWTQRFAVPTPGGWYQVTDADLAAGNLLDVMRRAYGLTTQADRRAALAWVSRWNQALVMEPPAQFADAYPWGVIDASASYRCNPASAAQSRMPGNCRPVIFIPPLQVDDAGLPPPELARSAWRR